MHVSTGFSSFLSDAKCFENQIQNLLILNDYTVLSFSLCSGINCGTGIGHGIRNEVIIQEMC